MIKIEKQTVYLPVKVEDELPENGKILAINPKIDKPFEIMYSKEENIFICGNVRFFPKDSGISHCLKPQEGYFFTPEQLNQLLSDVIKDTLNAAETQKETCICNQKVCKCCDKSNEIIKSITNTFDETFNKFKV